MFVTKAAWPFSYRSATRGRLACTPKVSHGCEWPLCAEILIMPSWPIATSPRTYDTDVQTRVWV
eukprot:scaffold44894_cov61-Phaeocystis_antarctica.AAC.1